MARGTVTSRNELLELADALRAELEVRRYTYTKDAIMARIQCANELDRAWSGSFLGYHADVYHHTLLEPPSGDFFDPEWGLKDPYETYIVNHSFKIFRESDIRNTINERSGDIDLGRIKTDSSHLAVRFREAQSEAQSLLHNFNKDTDKYLSRIENDINKIVIHNVHDFLSTITIGRHITRDMTAISQGTRIPAHKRVIAELLELFEPFRACEELERIVRQAGSHVSRREKISRRMEVVGTNIFIGHGRSPLWRELKDFLEDRIGLPVDEFNRVPIAGVTNIARLSEMLEAAAIAFLILTAEDEQSDGSHSARMNVVHEAGLFQGRLGFTRAIILLEDGCNQFSNIEGLGQLRFPSGNINAIFEDIRRVLERENLIRLA